MNDFEQGYISLLRKLVYLSRVAPMTKDRTGTGVYSLFGKTLTADLRVTFPMLVSKKVHWKSVKEELLWFVSGSTNAKDLQAKGVTIWDEWAAADGSLGPVYGKQWRDFGGVDQLTQVVENIRNRDVASSRRLIVSAWNPPEIPQMALPPCHLMFQFHVDEDFLDLQFYQRSADIFLGVPFNMPSYALLLSMVAECAGLIPRKVIQVMGDVHLYSNHVQQAQQQLDTWDDLSLSGRTGPTLSLVSRSNLFDYRSEDATLVGYKPQKAIKAPVAV